MLSQKTGSALTMIEQKTSAGKHLLDGTIRVSMAEALMFPTGLVTAAFLTRWLGPSDYGLLTLAATLVGWIQWSIASMLNRASCIHISQATDWRDIGTVALRLFLAAGVLAAIMLWWLAESIASLLGEPQLAGLLQLFAVDIPLFALVQAHRNILIGTGRYRQRAWSSAGRWLARMVLIVALVWAGFSVEGAILGSIGATVLELLISRYFVKPRLFGQTEFPAIRLLRFAIPFYLFATCMQFFGKMDLFALKLLGGTAAQAGIYGAAQNLALVPIMFSLSFAPLLQSTLIRMVKDKQMTDARSMAGESIRLAILFLPFAAMTAGAAAEITSLIFGSAFIDSGPILAWLIAAAVLNILVSVNTGILIAAEKIRLILLITAVLVPVAILGFLYIIPSFGPVGAAMVTFCVFLIITVSSSAAVRYTWRLTPPIVTVLRSLALSLLAFSVAYWWPTTGVLLILKLGIICLGIPLFFFIIGEITKPEIIFVLSTFRNNPGSATGFESHQHSDTELD